VKEKVPGTFSPKVLAPDPVAHFGVISDIDDTILDTRVADKVRMLGDSGEQDPEIYAAGEGFISPAALPLVRREKAASRAPAPTATR
jgi:hypothetical protein